MNTFHVSLHVSDLPAAIARYRQILGIEPAKVRHDYAKFELTDPPAIVSLNVSDTPGTVGHLGIRYAGTADVATEIARARREGLDLLEQKGTTCCYATADKFWVQDADGMRWEMYAVTADADAPSAADQQLAAAAQCTSSACTSG